MSRRGERARRFPPSLAACCGARPFLGRRPIFPLDRPLPDTGKACAWGDVARRSLGGVGGHWRACERARRRLHRWRRAFSAQKCNSMWRMGKGMENGSLLHGRNARRSGLEQFRVWAACAIRTPIAAAARGGRGTAQPTHEALQAHRGRKGFQGRPWRRCRPYDSHSSELAARAAAIRPESRITGSAFCSTPDVTVTSHRPPGSPFRHESARWARRTKICRCGAPSTCGRRGRRFRRNRVTLATDG